MVDLIEKIGPYLGIAAFLGLAVLAFLIFQQAREVRRLREWAGRAPERAEEAADAIAAVTEARGEAGEAAAEEEAKPAEAEVERGRLGTWWAGVRHRFDYVYEELDRRSPVDPRYILVVIAALALAAGVLTSGFGLGGDGESSSGGSGGKHGGGQQQEEKSVEVAVLNATQERAVGNTEVSGVPGLAGTVADEVVKPAGYKAGAETNAPEGQEDTLVMFEPDEQDAANELAAAISDQLGEPDVVEMTDDVRSIATGAPLALLIGRDNADFGEAGNSG
ncbi:MAG TPA: LytR C-terminal domain-containing protein [Solirubrobacterales bacterium]|nr:LytR C-terminal domain-containing protein [Solirubrobacterales bacterium]